MWRGGRGGKWKYEDNKKYEVRGTKYEVAKLWHGDGEGQRGGASFAGVLAGGVGGGGVRGRGEWGKGAKRYGCGGENEKYEDNKKYEVRSGEAGERRVGWAAVSCGEQGEWWEG